MEFDLPGDVMVELEFSAYDLPQLKFLPEESIMKIIESNHRSRCLVGLGVQQNRLLALVGDGRLIDMGPTHPRFKNENIKLSDDGSSMLFAFNGEHWDVNVETYIEGAQNLPVMVRFNNLSLFKESETHLKRA